MKFNVQSLISMVLFGGISTASALAADLLVPSQYTTIQAAVNAASNGDRVLVANGVYTAGFSFNGKLITVVSQSGSLSTTLDLSGVAGYAVDATSAEPFGTQIIGFSIRGCTSGAVRVSNGASLTMTSCRVFDCTAVPPASGAGVKVTAGDFSATNCWFGNLVVSGSGVNTAASGAAIFAENDANLSLSGCQFENCQVSLIYGGGGSQNQISARGGAVALTASSASLNMCSFDGCSSQTERTAFTTSSYLNTTASGGAVDANNGSNLALTNCVFGAVTPCFAKAVGRRGVIGCSWQGCAPVGADFVITSALGGSVGIANSTCEIISSVFHGGYCVAQTFTTSDMGYACPEQSVPPPLNDSEVTALGGHVYCDMQSASHIHIVGSTFESGSVSANSLGQAGTFYTCGHVEQGIISRADGSSVSIRPGMAGSGIDHCGFVQCGSPSCVDIASGGALPVENSTFDDCLGVSLATRNNGSITNCELRNGSASPISFYGTGSGPIISNTTSCGNNPNSFLGAWIDGGGNQFVAICIVNDCNGNGIEDSYEIQTGAAPDCNTNGKPDSCDILNLRSDDCDENEIPDECQYHPTNVTSQPLSPVQYGTTLTATFTTLPLAGGEVTISVTASADLSSSSETVAVWGNGGLIGTLFAVGGVDCSPVTQAITVQPEAFNALVSASGTVNLQFVPSFTVTAATCPNSNLVASLTYQPSVLGDCNANATPDYCDITYGGIPDSNSDGIPDSCQTFPCIGDFNNDGIRDGSDLGTLLGSWGSDGGDLNGDGLTDGADLGALLGGWGPCPN